jgi:hypothetical protein
LSLHSSHKDDYLVDDLLGRRFERIVRARGVYASSFVPTGLHDIGCASVAPRALSAHGLKYGSWATVWNALSDANNVTDDIANGRIRYSTWEPWNNSVGVPLDDIINGVQDTLIQQHCVARRAGGRGRREPLAT